jgi:hypothetical protein
VRRRDSSNLRRMFF